MNNEYTEEFKRKVNEIDKETDAGFTQESAKQKIHDIEKLALKDRQDRRCIVYMNDLTRALRKRNYSIQLQYENGMIVNKDEIIKCFPTADELNEKTLKEFESLYINILRPTDMMARLVDHLEDDNIATASDTLRVKILKQFIHRWDSSNDKVANLKIKPVVEDVLKMHLSAKEIKSLTDMIDKRKEAIGLLTDEDFQYLLENSERFSSLTKQKERAKDSEKKKEADLALSKLKQEMQDKYPGKGMKLMEFPALKMVDSLASGRYKANRADRKDLYIFAAFYGMKVRLPGEGDKKDSTFGDPFLDVQKNLFFDCYNNTFLSYIEAQYNSTDQKNGGESSTAGSKKGMDSWNGVERDPTCEGINYKNAAEVLSVYYLNLSNSDIRKYSQKESPCVYRVKRICQAFKDVNHLDVEQAPHKATQKYRDFVFGKGQGENGIMDMKPSDAEALVKKNFFRFDKSEYNGQVAKQSITAQKELGKMYKEIVSKIPDNADILPDAKNYDTEEKLWNAFYDALMHVMIGREEVQKDLIKDGNAKKIYGEITGYLTEQFQKFGKKLPEMIAKPDSTIRRTDILLAETILVYLDLLHGEAEFNFSIRNIINKFTDVDNGILEACRFQPFTEKNALDMTLVLMVFQNLTEDMG